MSKKLEALKSLFKGHQLVSEGFRLLYEYELERKANTVDKAPVAQNEAKNDGEDMKEEKTAPTEKTSSPVKTSNSVKPAEKPVVQEKPATQTTQDDEDENSNDLESMTDAELKALAKDMGIKMGLGMRRARLLEAVRAKIAEENKKKAKTMELPEDGLMKRLREETEDMSDDEIRDLLAEAEISEKGGRTALLAKLHEAVKNGVINFDEDDEDSVVTEEDAEDELVSDDDEEQDTPERIKAIEVFDAQNRESFERGELEVGAMKEFLKENFNITMPKKATPAEVLDAYIEHAINFIDDDGNTVEEGAYSVRGVPYCCGVPLEIKKDKRGNTIGKCSICGESYEIDDTEE